MGGYSKQGPDESDDDYKRRRDKINLHRRNKTASRTSEQQLIDNAKARKSGKVYRENMSETQKSKKKARDKKARYVKKRDRLKENGTLFEEGKRICSRCYSKKALTEYSTWKNCLTKKYNKICDACLIKLYAYKECDEFSPEFWRQKAYSCNTSSVIRYKKLGEAVGIQDLPYKITGEDLIKLFVSQGKVCKYCREDLIRNPFQLDHRNPLSKHGEHHIDNIDILCVTCNRVKHDTPPDEFKEILRDYAIRVLECIELEDKEPQG